MREPRPEDWMSDDHLAWTADGRVVLNTADPDDPGIPATDWRERVARALPSGTAAWYVDRLSQPHLIGVGALPTGAK